MNKTQKYLIIGGTLVLLLLIPTMGYSNIQAAVADFIISNEGFLPVAKWDYKQYTWGYGTRAPGAGATITKDQAFVELERDMKSDFTTLSGLITRSLTANQWAAILDFSFNEGIGAAEKIVDDINSGNDDNVFTHFRLYIYAGGVVSSDLVERREKEIALWQS